MERNLSDLVYQGMAILFFTTAITLFFNLYYEAFRLQDALQDKISTERGDVVTKAINDISQEQIDQVSGAYLITEVLQGTTITIVYPNRDHNEVETTIQGKEQGTENEHFEESASIVDTSKVVVNGIYKREMNLFINDDGSNTVTIKYRRIR